VDLRLRTTGDVGTDLNGDRTEKVSGRHEAHRDAVEAFHREVIAEGIRRVRIGADHAAMEVCEAVFLIGIRGHGLVEHEIHARGHQLGGGLRAVDLTGETSVEPLLELADMVVVSVGDHQGEDLGRSHREGPRIVKPLPFGFTLEGAAVDDHVLVVGSDVEEVDGTRHRTTGTVGLVEQRRVTGFPGVGDRRHEGAELRLRRSGEGGVVEQRAEGGADVRAHHSRRNGLRMGFGWGFGGGGGDGGKKRLEGVRCVEAKSGDGMFIFIGRDVFHVLFDLYGIGLREIGTTAHARP
jgi:hypothetical protein